GRTRVVVVAGGGDIGTPTGDACRETARTARERTGAGARRARLIRLHVCATIRVQVAGVDGARVGVVADTWNRAALVDQRMQAALRVVADVRGARVSVGAVERRARDADAGRAARGSACGSAARLVPREWRRGFAAVCGRVAA